MRTDFRVKVKFFCADPPLLLLKLTLQWTLRVIKLILLFRSTFDGLFQSSIKHSHLVFNPLSLSLSFASLYHSFVHLWANLTQNFYIICYLFPSDVIRISVYHLPTYPSVICYWYTRYLYLSFSLFLSLTLRTYIGTGSDPSNDCHSVLVVAAAVASGARIIIKWRPKIFPKSVFTSFSAMTVFLCLSRENAKRFLRFDFGETK